MTGRVRVRRLLAAAGLAALLAAVVTTVAPPRDRPNLASTTSGVDLSAARPAAGAPRIALSAPLLWPLVAALGAAFVLAPGPRTPRSTTHDHRRRATGRQFDPWIPERAPPRDT